MTAPVVQALERVCTEVPVPKARPCGNNFLLLRGEVVYVGQTVHLEARLEQHQSNGVEFDRVLWCPVPEAELDAWEGAIIRALLPPLCRKAPPYQGCDNAVLAQLGLPQHKDELAAVNQAYKVLLERRSYDYREFRKRRAARRARLRRALWTAVKPYLATEGN